MNYNPRNDGNRKELATRLQEMFQRAEFLEVQLKGCQERVFAREVPGTDGKVRVLVYSTIEGDKTRAVAKDAIRVCAVYKAHDGRDRGIASADARVNRVGTVSSIEDRVLSRMREVWKATKTASKCPRCGAPHFKSKTRKDGRGGNLVCADLCWLSAGK